MDAGLPSARGRVTIIFCEWCKCEVHYHVKKKTTIFTFNEREIEVEVKYALCDTCGKEIDVEEFEDEAIDTIERIYRRKWCN